MLQSFQSKTVVYYHNWRLTAQKMIFRMVEIQRSRKIKWQTFWNVSPFCESDGSLVSLSLRCLRWRFTLWRFLFQSFLRQLTMNVISSLSPPKVALAETQLKIMGEDQACKTKKKKCWFVTEETKKKMNKREKFLKSPKVQRKKKSKNSQTTQRRIKTSKMSK